MTTIVVGGHSRKVGKTSLAEAILASSPDLSWTAVKISSHWHADGSVVETDDGREFYRIDEEYNWDGSTDTGRYLAAGASRSFWVRIRDGCMEKALPGLKPILSSNRFILIESSGIVQYVKPDLYLMVLRYDIADFKESARETFSQAHAIVAVNAAGNAPAWKEAVPETVSGIPVFTVEDPKLLTPDLAAFIRRRLGTAQDRT